MPLRLGVVGSILVITLGVMSLILLVLRYATGMKFLGRIGAVLVLLNFCLLAIGGFLHRTWYFVGIALIATAFCVYIFVRASQLPVLGVSAACLLLGILALVRHFSAHPITGRRGRTESK